MPTADRIEAGKSPFAEAVGRIVRRIARSLEGVGGPVRMVLAGGVAVHLHTGARMSHDIDASFSHLILLPKDMISPFDADDGTPRTVYFDRGYNSTLGLMHPDAEEDAWPVDGWDVDRDVLDVRVLAPVDLAVSKLSRDAPIDRADIDTLATHGLIRSEELSRRGTEALDYYVGSSDWVRETLRQTVERVEAIVRRNSNLGVGDDPPSANTR